MRQAELAERCGVAERTVSDWETGKATPRNTVRIEEALGIALDDPPPEETVSVDTEDTDGGRITLYYRSGALDGLSATQRDEVIAAGRLAVLRAIDEIRRR